MRLDVRELLEGSIERKTLEYEESLEAMEGLSFGKLPYVSLSAEEADGKVILFCNVKTVVILECSRCLQLYPQPLEFSYREVYSEEPFRIVGELTEEDFKFTIENNTIDISSSVRENIIINLPIKPLCRPDCKGLCPVCGKNLNEGDCSCNTRDIITLDI
ncbi:MAG: YceD family protein [bacterium]